MYKIIATIASESDKKTIYRLREELVNVATQHSCKVNIDIASNGESVEQTSMVFSEMSLKSDDIVDMTLTGDEQYELLERKEREVNNEENKSE